MSMPITSVEKTPLEELYALAQEHPEQWWNIYRREYLRRSESYQNWLTDNQYEHNEDRLDYFTVHGKNKK